MSKERKAYPTFEERIVAADKKIEELTKLIDDRKKLIFTTENKLNLRKAALEKSIADLEEANKKKARLIEIKNRPPKPPKAPKMDPEERKAQRIAAITKAREARAAKKAQADALMEALQSSGKTVDELLAIIKK